jgi:hypothetical protein
VSLPSNCVNGFTFVVHSIAGADYSDRIWEQFGCMVLRPIAAKGVLKMSVC